MARKARQKADRKALAAELQKIDPKEVAAAMIKGDDHWAEGERG